MTFQSQTCIEVEGVLLQVLSSLTTIASTRLEDDKQLTITLLRAMRRRRRRWRRGRLLPQGRRGGRYRGLCWRWSRRRTDGRRAPVLLWWRRLRARLGALLRQRVAEGAVRDEAVPPASATCARRSTSQSTELGLGGWRRKQLMRREGDRSVEQQLRRKECAAGGRTWRRGCRSRIGTPGSRRS
jgi:hypothetical protein